MDMRMAKAAKCSFVVGLGLIAVLTVIIVSSNGEEEDVTKVGDELSLLLVDSSEDSREGRVRTLRRVCHKYSDPFRPESASLSLADAPRSFGTEVVHIGGRDGKRASVCVPHKAGSHSWGRFARELLMRRLATDGDGAAEDDARVAAMDFAARAAAALKVVVVRHPLTRLLSVYRMIFEDWCDPDKFLAKQWDNVCKMDFVKVDQEEEEEDDEDTLTDAVKDGFNFGGFVSAAFKQHREGNDRFMLKLWRRFHPKPEELVDPKTQLKLTFPEFADFLIDGSAVTTSPSSLLSDATELSYHWSPFWKECPVCALVTAPDAVVRMETLRDDVAAFAAEMGLDGEGGVEFPHTHSLSGGHSSEMALAKRYFSQLSKEQIVGLYQKYRVDHELFGYSPDAFIEMGHSQSELSESP